MGYKGIFHFQTQNIGILEGDDEIMTEDVIYLDIPETHM